MKYILNVADAVAHFADIAGEKCNKTKRYADDLPEGYRLCEHCVVRRSRLREELLPQSAAPDVAEDTLSEESDGRE